LYKGHHSERGRGNCWRACYELKTTTPIAGTSNESLLAPLKDIDDDLGDFIR